MEAIAETLYGILHHETTTMVVVVLAVMAVGLTLHAVLVHVTEGLAFARIEKKERAERVARVTAERAERDAELTALGVVLPE